MIQENIRVFADVYLEDNPKITDADLQKYICKAMGFGDGNVDLKDIREVLGKMAKENKIKESLILDDLAIYDRVASNPT